MLTSIHRCSVLFLLLAVGRGAAQDPPQGSPARADSLTVVQDSSSSFRTPPFWGTLPGGSPRRIELTADSLRWLTHRSLAEALPAVGGIGIREPSTAGGYAQLHLQGIDQRGIAFLLDGRPLNDPAIGILNLDHLQGEDAALLEIVTGARAFLTGMEHPVASVNLVTREWDANKAYTRLVYGEAGDAYGYSDGTFAQNISRRVSVTAGFQHLGASGKDIRTPHEQWNVRGRVRTHLGNGWIASLAERYATTQTDLNGGFDPQRTPAAGEFDSKLAAVVNGDSYEKIDRHDLDLSFVRISPEESTATTRLTLHHTDIFREYRDEENRPGSNGVFISSNHHLRRSGIQGTQVFRDGGRDLAAGAGFENLRSVASPNLGRLSSWNPFAWASAGIKVGAALRVGIFGRIERVRSLTGTGVGADVSLEVAPPLRVFGGISIAHRLPGLFETEWRDTTISRPAPIGRERHFLIEAGIEYRPSPRSTVGATLFRRVVDDPVEILALAGPSPFGGLTIEQGPGLVSTGVEAGGRWQFWYILLEGSGTIQSLTREGAGTRRFPRLMARGGIYCRGSFFSGSLDLRGGVRGRYTGASTGDRFNPEFLVWGNPGSGEIPGWSSLDAVLAARIGDAHIQLVWENLTDVGAYSARYEFLRPRNIRLGLAWEFVN